MANHEELSDGSDIEVEFEDEDELHLLDGEAAPDRLAVEQERGEERTEMEDPGEWPVGGPVGGSVSIRIKVIIFKMIYNVLNLISTISCAMPS